MTERTQRDLMLAALVALRDVVDDFDGLPAPKRREAVRAAAAFIEDLRAAGVIR